MLHKLKERPRARGQKRRVRERDKRQETRGSRKESEEWKDVKERRGRKEGVLQDCENLS
jgi:hypothetical protein